MARGEQKSLNQRGGIMKSLNRPLLVLKMEWGPQAKEYRWPLDAEKDKKTGFPPEPPEGAQFC